MSFHYTPTETLYQFCSIESFRNIIASKLIWYTDLGSANDPRELKLGPVRFAEALKFVAEHECEGRIRETILDVARSVERERERAQCFCACFSPINDELPMWREYGGNYRGVAIGFRPEAITSMPGIIQKVRYLQSDIENELRSIAREISGKSMPPGIAKIFGAIASLGIITAIKHRTWEYEKEIRLVFQQSRTRHDGFKEWPDGTKIFWEAPLSRTRGTERVEYKAFPFAGRGSGSDRSRAIAAVVVGPRCELPVDDIKFELEKNGFEEFEIVKSECEIR